MSEKHAASHFDTSMPDTDKKVSSVFLFHPPPPIFFLVYVRKSRQKQVERHTFFQYSISAGYTKKYVQNCCLCSRISRIYQSLFIYQKKHCSGMLSLHMFPTSFRFGLFFFFCWLGVWSVLRGFFSFFLQPLIFE